jgi:hypothetical protein
MALKNYRIISFLCLLIIVGSSWIPTGQAQALTGDIPTLAAFVSQVKNGRAEDLVGVYIPGQLAAQVARQPKGNTEFVTTWPNFVTQLSSASKFGSTGLIAHNHLAGQGYAGLATNQTFHLVYGNGTTSEFVVTEIQQYQALEPNSVSSTFKNLVNGESLSASELFLQAYDRPGMVVLQTCISTTQDSAWGRLFIIAEPVAK